MLTGTAARRGDTAGPQRSRRSRREPALRSAGAVLAGLGLYATFPPLDLWWLGPPAVALWLVVIAGRRFRAALGWSALAAVAFQAPLLSWTGEFVGPVWLLLLAVLTAFVAVPAAATTLVARLPGAPFWQAGVWVAGEALIARWPFEGFAWAKLAFGQPGGVFAPLARLGGAPLITFAVVLCGAGAAALVLAWRTDHRRATAFAAVPALLLGPVAGLLTLPAVLAPSPGPSVTVAAVQGNVPRAGLDFAAQRRAVLDNHVAATERLAADVAMSRTPRPDLVIWPENSSDIDPLRNADAAAAIQSAADVVGAPVVVGAVLRGDSGPRNTMIVWAPRGGAGAQYTKRHIMPFGEYIPFKPIAQLMVGVDLDRYQDFVPGDGPGVLPAGPARLGIATCYEVVFDRDVRSAVRAGADLLAVPTNNATFGFTDMTYQQQGMSRLRAVEHDRAVVIAATSGQSAIVDPAGRIVDRTGALFTPGVLVQRVPLLTTTTPATAVGPVPELVLAALGVSALGAVVVARLRRRGTGA